MSFAAANRARKHTKPAAAKATEPQAEAPPILGVDLKGELLDVELAKIIDPKLPSDRLERDGDDERVRHLAKSMSEVGQLQPVMLERLVDGRFARVFGRRRVSAARILKWDTIRAVVVPPLPDDVRRTVVAVENVQRQDLTPAEETLAVSELLELQAHAAAKQLGKPLAEGCGACSGRMVSSAVSFDEAGPEAKKALSHDALLDHRVRGIACELVAAMLAKPASWVRDRMYLLRLSEKARKLVLSGKLPLAHAREIAKLADPKRRDELAEDYAAGGDCSISDSEPGKLEELQEDVRRSVFALNVVPWRLEVPFAGKPACVGCPNNSTTSPGLFEHGGEVSHTMVGGRGTYDTVAAAKAEDAGVCTLPACYEVKLRAAKSAISAAANKIVNRPARKKGEPAPKPVSVPAYVDSKALDKKVRARKGGRSASKPKAASKPSAAQAEKVRLQNLKTEAFRDWKSAMVKRAQAAEAPIAKALAKKPGAWAVLQLVLSSKPYEATHDYNDAKRERAVASSKFRSLINLLAKPDWEAVVAVEKECGRQYAIFDNWHDGYSGVVDLIAEALGVELPAAPKVESFYPKELKEATKAKGVTESDIDEVDAEDEE